MVFCLEVRSSVFWLSFAVEGFILIALVTSLYLGASSIRMFCFGLFLAFPVGLCSGSSHDGILSVEVS